MRATGYTRTRTSCGCRRSSSGGSWASASTRSGSCSTISLTTAVALDEALAAAEHGTEQQEMTMFTDFDPAAYEGEARERWSDTEAYRESARRTASYGDARERE